MATGRSDYPNQMKLAAARGRLCDRSELSEEYIIPSVFNKAVALAVAAGVADAAQQTGAARRRLDLAGVP